MPTATPDAKSSGPGPGPGGGDAKGGDSKSIVDRRKRKESLEEQRRFMKWMHFSEDKVSFGFEHLPTIALPLMSDERTGYAVRFEKITSWSIPAGILRAAAVVHDDLNKYEYQLQLSLSMYHLTSGSFFGSTWMGSPVKLNPNIFSVSETTTRVPMIENESDTGEDSNVRDSLRQSRTSQLDGAEKKMKTVVTKVITSKVIDFEYQDIIYMISRIIDPSCVAVVEVVLTKLTKTNNVVVGQYGCGWTMLNLFQRPLPIDVADDRDHMKLLSVNMFAGSPRDLAVITDMKQLTEHLKPIPDCQLFLKMFTHRRLLRAQKYLSENVPIGRFDPVAGLVNREVVLPNTTRPVWLSCFGDEERIDAGQGVHIYPAKPRLALPLVFKIANCQLYVPKRDSLEIRLIESVHRILPTEQKKEKIRIVSRTLKFALHNGLTIVGNRWYSQGLKEDKDDRDILLINDAVVSLPGFIPDVHMAIVFLVEYQIGVLDETNHIMDPKALISSVTELPKQQESSFNTVTTGLLGAGAYVPYDGHRVVLSNTGRPPDSAEGVDVEVKLYKDKSCAMLSPLPVLSDRGADTTAAAGAAVDATADEKNPNLRVSYMYESKGGASLAAAARKFHGDDEENDDEDDVPMLGFDLRLFHPKSGELKNLDAAEGLNKLEERDTGALAAAEEAEEEEPPQTLTKEELRKSQERKLKEQDELAASSASRFRKSTTAGVIADSERTVTRAAREDEEDLDSVVESIVAGDEDRSKLRLDPYFYTSFAKKEIEKQKPRENEEEEREKLGEREIAKFDFGKRPSARQDSQLFAHSMNAKLQSRASAQDDEGVFPLRGQRPVAAVQENAELLVAGKTVVAAYGNEHYLREVSRGAKSRLNRHGIQDAIADSAFAAMQDLQQQQSYRQGAVRPLSAGVGVVRPVDLDLEIYDEQNVHEINIQFAGFRAKVFGNGENGGSEALANSSFVMPKSVYFSFQFFTCAPTRSETLRVESVTTPGEMHVLSRDDPQARNEPPLTLRYAIDCSRASPLEALEFAEYLAHKSLYVDVWDAEGLLHLGTLGIPLRMLLRQGQSMVKQSVECDVINAESAAPTEGGVVSLTVVDRGPVAGEVVGAVSVLLSNYGYKGQGPYVLSRKTGVYGSTPIAPIEGLNWRAHGVDSAPALSSLTQTTGQGGAANRVRARPKNKVRAKPLSETAPELSRALQDIRELSASNAASFRSLSGHRGAGGQSTLNYDEVVILFKRFPGATRGSVQYAGDLMKLLDLPSLSMVLKKLTKAFRQYSDQLVFKTEILRNANSAEELKPAEIEEFLRILFEKTGIKSREEERTLLSQKILTDCGNNGFVKASRLAAFASEESDRQDWAMVSNRLKLCAQRAELENVDVEQLLADFDPNGTNFISTRKFRDFLTKLSTFGKLYANDVTLCCRYFSRHARTAALGDDRDAVSLAEVSAALGREYVGNLQARAQRALQRLRESGETAIDAKFVLRLLNGGKESENERSANTRGGAGGGGVGAGAGVGKGYSYEVVEGVFRALSLTAELSSQQVKGIVRKLDAQGLGRVTAVQLLSYLAIPFTAAELQPTRETSLSGNNTTVETDSPEITAEFLLRLLLEKAQKNGLAVDEAFRHFDTNGDGFIAPSELQQGLRSLSIFESIPQWTSQLPRVVRQFDKSGDGRVSLREFFAFLGFTDYAPNIVQRLTRIFAVATQRGASLGEIFEELDADKDGALSAEELVAALKRLGTFGEVTDEDARAVVRQFNTRDNKDKGVGEGVSNKGVGDERVSIREFVSFFSSRVSQHLAQRRVQRVSALAARLRDVLRAARDKGGVGVETLFSHLDTDRSDTLSANEFSAALRALPSMKNVSQEEIDEFFAAMDRDKSGAVSLKEFEKFLQEGVDIDNAPPNTARSALSGNVSESLPSNVSGKTQLGSERVSARERARDDEKRREEEESKEQRALRRRLDSDREGEGKRDRERDRDLSLSDKRELFLRHVRRVAEVDGGPRGLLAFLDDDEDGLVLRSRLFHLLRREDVFESPSLSETDVDELISHCFTVDGKHVQVAPLLYFLENQGKKRDIRFNSASGKSCIVKDLVDGEEGDEDGERSAKMLADQAYEFSRDLETHAVEKKMRQFGRILAKNGVDVERAFLVYDARRSGCVLRTDFVKVLSSLGVYLLEEGKVMRDGVSTAGGALERDVQALQRLQIERVKGLQGTFLHNAPRLARKIFDHPVNGNFGEFKGHLESMTVIDWYRQSQKQVLLQQVLSHSLAHHINLFPRFGKTSYFEYPLYNPFNHEERFVIEISDPELRLVTDHAEWTHLRRAVRPCAGELGPDPLEDEMFDVDELRGTMQVALLPHETLYVPFAFVTLSPYVPPRTSVRSAWKESAAQVASRRGERERERARNGQKLEEQEEEDAQRHIDVTIVSGSHGNVVAVLKVHCFPRPFVVDRVLRFHEFENTIARRRVRLTGITASSAGPAVGDFAMHMKYIHCVETTSSSGSNSNSVSNVNINNQNSRVVVEWGSALLGGETLPAGRAPSSKTHARRGEVHGDGDTNIIDMLIRYRCRDAPDLGMFYLLVYDDPFQHVLHETWQVVVHSRLRLDMHGTVGATSTADLVIRGDQHTRRVKAFASSSQLQSLSFHPENVFQLMGGAYNRVVTTLQPKYVGQRRALVNVVDVDSKELLSAWLVSVQATAPAVMRSYDVEVQVNKPVFKKILFQNPWDVQRKFVVSSSDERLMRPRTSVVEVAPLGAAYLRLWINGWQQGSSGVREVHLFMNDAEEGQNEECHLFRIREANPLFDY